MEVFNALCSASQLGVSHKIKRPAMSVMRTYQLQAIGGRVLLRVSDPVNKSVKFLLQPLRGNIL